MNDTRSKQALTSMSFIKRRFLALSLEACKARMRSRLATGRPLGSVSFDPIVASAFGSAVVEMRTQNGLSQLALASAASVERSHMGRIERGESVPNLSVIVRIATALGCTAALLTERFEQKLPDKKRGG